VKKIGSLVLCGMLLIFSSITLVMASTPAAASDTEIDATLVLDDSGSMSWDNRWENAEEASINFVKQMDENDRAAIYGFGDPPSGYPDSLGPEREKEFTQTDSTGKDEVIDAIEDMSPGGGTPLYDTIGYAIDYTVDEKRGDSTGALVVMTDGLDNINYEFYPTHDYREEEYVSEDEHHFDQEGYYYGLLNCPELVYIVGLDIEGLFDASMDVATEDEVDEYIERLEEIAESSGGKYYSVEEAEELDDVYQEIHEEIEEEAEDDDICGLLCGSLFLAPAGLFISVAIYKKGKW